MGAFIRRFRRSDEQYIEDVRRSVARFDRYGRPMVAGITILLTITYLAIVAVVSWFLSWGLAAPNGLNPLQAIAGFVIGLMLGIQLGFMLMRIIHDLSFVIDLNRKERLLVRLHDALQERSREPEYDSEEYPDDDPTG